MSVLARSLRERLTMALMTEWQKYPGIDRMAWRSMLKSIIILTNDRSYTLCSRDQCALCLFNGYFISLFDGQLRNNRRNRSLEC